MNKRMMKIKTALPVCLLLAAATGCYKQAPLGDVTPAPATRIVATLTDSGTVIMGNALGPGAMKVEGLVARADSEQWILNMVRVEHRDQRTVEWNGEPVNFPRRVLADPAMVVLDKKRSWLTAAGVTLLAVVVATAFDLIGAPEEQFIPEQPPLTRVPLRLELGGN